MGLLRYRCDHKHMVVPRSIHVVVPWFYDVVPEIISDLWGTRTSAEHLFVLICLVSCVLCCSYLLTYISSHSLLHLTNDATIFILQIFTKSFDKLAERQFFWKCLDIFRQLNTSSVCKIAKFILKWGALLQCCIQMILFLSMFCILINKN